MRAWSATACLAVGLLSPALPVQAEPDDGTAAFREEFVTTHCLSCHGPETQRGDFRIDTTPYDLAASGWRAQWQRVIDFIDDEDMPPPRAPRHPSRAERDRMVALIRADMAAADEQAPVGGSLLRRLNRVELLNSVQDLFGIRGIRLPSGFPEDMTDLPFDTMPAGLAFSAAHLNACMELAVDVAERMVFVPGRELLSTESDMRAWSQEQSVWQKDGDASATYFTGVNVAAWGGAVWDRGFIAPTSGTYEVRVRASAEGDAGVDGQPLRLGFYALSPAEYDMPESANRVDLPRVGSLDVTAREPDVLTCTVELEKGESFHVYCENRLPVTGPQRGLNRIDLAQLVIAAKANPLPSVRIEHMAVTGPVAPLARQVAFLGRARASGDEAFLRSVLLPLAERAYRRPLTVSEELDLLAPVLRHLDEVPEPELALRFGIRRILHAPAFLYLDARKGPLDGYALASRLSYFLWSSMPDAELVALAAAGRIAESDVLRAQVLRMLGDPKAQRFVRDFTGQWLGNRQLATLMVCDVRYVWNELLRDGFIRSTEAFFAEVLRENHGIRTFLDSDFTYASLPMRMVWGFPGEYPAMSRLESNQAQSHVWPEPERLDLTSLPRGVPPNVAHRGGVLGLPGVLTLTGDGVESSPILRGVWVLENLYGTPPPPPPDDVPALVSDTSGATTIREVLAAHQESASCSTCHARIDPVGFALENYDAVGNWRAGYYRERPEEGGPLPAKPVDPTGVLPDGVRLAGPQDIKRHLLANSAMFTRCLATKLLEYSTGRRMSVGDARVVERIVRDEPSEGYGFRDLVTILVDSEVFRTQ